MIADEVADWVKEFWSSDRVSKDGAWVGEAGREVDKVVLGKGSEKSLDEVGLCSVMDVFWLR